MSQYGAVNAVLSYGGIENSLLVASAALILHDHIITLDKEVSVIWERKKTGVSVLFLLSRVFGAMLALSMFLTVLDWTSASLGRAIGVQMLLEAVYILQRTVYAAFATLRVYAISGSSWNVASTVLVLNLLSLVTELYLISVTPSALLGVLSDPSSMVALENRLHILDVVNGSGLVLADLIVLCVTWFYTYQIKREANAVHMEAPLATLLLRDGTMYFAIMTTLEITYLALYIQNIYIGLEYIGYAMMTIMTSRFILDLRNVGSTSGAPSSLSRPSFVASHASVRFAIPPSVLGNVGASLRSAFPLDGEDEYEWAVQDGGYILAGRESCEGGSTEEIVEEAWIPV